MIVGLFSGDYIQRVSVWLGARTLGWFGDDESHPPRLIEQEKGKRPKKTITKKKRKRGDTEAERAAVVAIAVERAERGGRGSGIRIGDQCHQLRGP